VKKEGKKSFFGKKDQKTFAPSLLKPSL